MLRDLIWAGRWLRKNRHFAFAIIAILTLGIGVTTAVFSVVDAVLLKPLPYPSSDRLVRIEETSTRRASLGTPSSDFLRWQDRNDLFERLLAYRRDLATLTGPGEPDQIWRMRTSAGLFSLLGVAAQQGRTLVESDDHSGQGNPAVLSDRLWKRIFHADAKALGRTLTLSSEAYTIVGVMPPEFEFPNPDVDLWVPLHVAPAEPANVAVIGRIRNGLSLSQIQSAMAIVAHQLEQEKPQKQAGLRIEVSPWLETPQREYELTLMLAFAAVGLVLLIACADVVSLLLSRAVQRQKEIAIRSALGAGFWRVLRQLLAESFLLALVASVAGLAAAHIGLEFLSKQMAALPVTLPHLRRVAINERVLLFTMGVCVFVGVMCSLAPLLLCARTDLQILLRGGQFAGGPKRPARLFSILIASEAAFAVVLLVGSGLMVRSLIRLQETDHGIRPDHVLTLRVPIGSPGGKYDTKPRQMSYYQDLVERLRSVAGVRAVAVVNNLPLSNANSAVFVKGPDGQPMLTSTRTISPEYFAVMGIARLAGRSFSDADKTGSPHVAIINESLAHQLFPNRDSLGQPLPSVEGGLVPTVVGVVKDSPQLSYDKPPRGEVYLPYLAAALLLLTIGIFASARPAWRAATGDPLKALRTE